MKKFLLALSFLFSLSLMTLAQNSNLTVKVSFKNINEGYDHDTKSVVFIDDNEVGEGPVHKQSKSNTMTLQVPTGKHKIRVMSFALYEGKWEEHTIENNYSLDCFVEEQHNFSKKETLYLVFDLKGEVRKSWNKPIK